MDQTLALAIHLKGAPSSVCSKASLFALARFLERVGDRLALPRDLVKPVQYLWVLARGAGQVSQEPGLLPQHSFAFHAASTGAAQIGFVTSCTEKHL